ncbi:MAG: serine/threonine-protein kinase [Propionibacteriales bacterium]|nr:serine/threonine-protein kinase [Propionibacteriales bacterium]
MSDADFWVGPVDEPDRYRLTHLLGSGGEGEVWRATRPGHDVEVAIKIDAVPEGSDRGWEARLATMATLRVEGLVRIEEAFVGTVRHRLDDEHPMTPTHRYVVMNHVDGITLRSWLDEHPDAPARDRIRILRRVARTLSTLHHRSGTEGSITHGDVKPSNVIIDRTGRPVVVDLGLLRPTGSGPVSGHSAAYSSPELRNPDSTPSPQADTFSFAVTAMETLTALTPPLAADGTLDLAATRARIANEPALRFRPALRRQLLRSLSASPERRPPTPVRVFAGRSAAAVAVPLVLVLGLAGSAMALGADGGPSAELAESGPTASVAGPTRTQRAAGQGTRAPSASPTPGGTPTPVVRTLIRDDGRFLSGDLVGGTAEYSADCGPWASNVVTDPLPALSTWGSSSFFVSLTSKHDLQVLSVTAKPVKAPGPRLLRQNFGVTCLIDQVSPPVPGGECPSTPPKPHYRLTTHYAADADRRTWKEDVKRRDPRPFGVMGHECSPASELAIDIDDCRTNVDYAMTVRFQLDDDPLHYYERTFPPMRLRARMNRGKFRTTIQGSIQHTVPFSGGPVRCGVPSVPYRDRQIEVFSLLFKGLREVRATNPDLSRTEAVQRITELLAPPEFYRMADPYTAAKILAVCARADLDKQRWRGTCGPPDPEPSGDPSPTP